MQDDYVKSLEQIARRKEDAAEEKHQRRLQVQSNKLKRVAEQREKDQSKLEKQALWTSKKQHKDAWSAKVVVEYGEKLHAFIKSKTAVPSWRALYCRTTPPICRENQKQALARLQAKRQGKSTSELPKVMEVSKPWLLQTPSYFLPSWQQSGVLLHPLR